MPHTLTKIAAGVLASAAVLALPLGALAQTSTTTPTTIAASTQITSNLALGSRGTQVSALQTFLATDPTIYPSGSVTGYFGPATQKAVSAFQAKYGLPVVGRVGPQTRAKINSLMTGGTGTVGTTSGTSPAITNVSGVLRSLTSASSPITSTTTTSTGTSTATSTDSTTGSTTPVTTTTTTTIGTATVSWNTDRPTSGKVFYSPIPIVFTENNSSVSEPYISGSVMSDPTLSSTKQITIGNLVASTTYYYMIEAIDANGNVSVTWPATFTNQ